MIFPIYKFEISAGGITQRCYPVYGDLSKEFDKESGQEFFRAKLVGKLAFERDDYTFISGKAIDTQFVLTMYVSSDAGATWASNWVGTFWKTDCEIDEDAKTITVTPEVSDIYKTVLDGLEKEYDLIELSPAMTQVKLDKRPMIQVYVPGQTVIGCFLSGMGWEQECEAIDDRNALVNDYYFSNVKNRRVIEISGNMSPTLPNIFMGSVPSSEQGEHGYTNSGYRFAWNYGGGTLIYSIIRTSDNVTLWSKTSMGVAPPVYPNEVVLSPVSGSGASGNVTAYIHDIFVYARYICDVDNINGTPTYEIPAEDIVENNRNYKRVIGYNFPDTILFGTGLTTTPTPYGLYQPGQYYSPPASYYYGEVFPIAKSAWGRVSIWFTFSTMDWIVEQYARKAYLLKDAYPLAAAISAILAKIAPGVTHDGTTAYSQFLYGANPLTGVTTVPVITPKSNLMYSGYDQPAQKAPITLKSITEMLRDAFRCYWFIDSNNRFRIEHISYFRNGMAYSGSPGIGADLTAMEVSRSGKKWAFGRDKYKFDKPEMAARYQFAWMDDCTQMFDGYPIEILSNYVQKDRIENIQIQQFSSDVDYILLNPSVISKDGFVLMLCTQTSYDTEEWEYFLQTPVEASVTEQEPTQHNVIDLTAYRGKRVRFSTGLTTGVSAYGYTEDSQGNLLDIVGSLFDDDPLGLWEFDVPSNAVGLTIYSSTGATVSFYTGAYQKTVTHLNTLGLPYVTIQENGIDHILQNGYAAFAYLQRFYAYDMPASSYQINGTTYSAFGVKKLKTQEVAFPQIAEPNLQQLIKTNLGNGKIRKMSLNLSSRNAKTTLEYDTE